MPGLCSKRLLSSTTSAFLTTFETASTSASASASASASGPGSSSASSSSSKSAPAIAPSSAPRLSAAASGLFHTSRPAHRLRTPWPWSHPRFHSTTSTSTEAASTTPSSSSSSSSSSFPFPSHPNPTPYQIFHLSPSASPAQIKARYYDLVRIFHPDRAIALSTPHRRTTEERFKLIVKAYELLSDRRRRTDYDRTGFGWGERRRWGTLRTGWEHRGDPASPTSRARAKHDQYGWQRNRANDEYFYGFAARQSPTSESQKQRYLPNTHFISLLCILTWTLALLQYSRLAAQASRATQRADKLHLDAAQSLKVAREGARGEEGRRRKEAVRRRVRELGVLEQVRAMESRANGEELEEKVEEEERPWGIGHGGPSGKEAHDERVRRAEARATGTTASA
ncbi:unnamed protein product [Tilletia controversa]|nr:unnamed protein product [Tilletia controversa]